MSDADGSKRIKARKVALGAAKQRISAFFTGRAEKRDAQNPYVSVIYQDQRPELATQRDRQEKELVLPKLALSRDTSVLDIGCGVGRWADALQGKVGRYLGVDFSPEMIELAQARHSDPAVDFRVLAAEAVSAKSLGPGATFDVVIIAGVFIYMDDEEIVRCLSGVREVAAAGARIYLREPLAVEERLTLNGVWSEELQQDYYAIYRTREEMAELIKAGLAVQPAEFQPLYEDAAMNNRAETRQFYSLLDVPKA